MENKYNKSGFSWHRVWMLSEYYCPIVRRQMVCYAIISLVCAILLLLPENEIAQFSIFTAVYSMLPLLFMLSPLIFAKTGDSRMIERQIPVSAAEKITFYAIYLLVVIPLTVLLLPEISTWLYTKIPSIQSDLMIEILKLRWKTPLPLIAINLMTAASGVCTCLYVVLHARTNRILKAVISVFAVQFGIGLIGGAYGFYMAFHEGINNMAYETSGAANDLSGAISLRVQESINTTGDAIVFQAVATVIILSYLVWIVRNIYKTLHRGGEIL